MLLLRKLVESAYLTGRDKIFERYSPNEAHDFLVKQSQTSPLLTKLFLNYSHNRHNPDVILSTAAGFNRDGDIPPIFLKYLGFDRSVVGTVTAEPWQGNPKPNMERLVESESLINWEGFPGSGCEKVRENLERDEQVLPLTINIMTTPNAKDLLGDLEKTLVTLSNFGDRIELNISCPNICYSREELQKNIYGMLERAGKYLNGRDLYVKLSPDISSDMLQNILEVSGEFSFVRGFVTSNTSTNHLHRDDEDFKGGASGDLLYPISRDTIFNLTNEISSKYSDRNWSVIACGGISSRDKVLDYNSLGIKEFQVFTPLIYKGPGLLRELRS